MTLTVTGFTVRGNTQFTEFELFRKIALSRLGEQGATGCFPLAAIRQHG
jgi:hypothetical protein